MTRCVGQGRGVLVGVGTLSNEQVPTSASDACPEGVVGGTHQNGRFMYQKMPACLSACLSHDQGR